MNQKKREIRVGGVPIGGGHPVTVQSMTCTRTDDVPATLGQIGELARAGCDIVRVAVPDPETLPAFRTLVRESPIPVIADVHFSVRMALGVLEAGAHGLRINPGNIGDDERLRDVIREASRRAIPLRIGVNGGSLKPQQVERHGGDRVAAMVGVALEGVALCEEEGFHQIKISLKSSDVREMIAAYRLLSGRCNYPLHLGVTEAGTLLGGAVRSAIGIGVLLESGIGDTIRVSLTDQPVREVEAGRLILQALGLRPYGVELISCPTCGRTTVPLLEWVAAFEARVRREPPLPVALKVALMGCEVNGPGEAAHADLGLAFSRGEAFLFARGRAMERVAADRALDLLWARMNEMAQTRLSTSRGTGG